MFLQVKYCRQKYVLMESKYENYCLNKEYLYLIFEFSVRRHNIQINIKIRKPNNEHGT